MRTGVPFSWEQYLALTVGQRDALVDEHNRLNS